MPPSATRLRADVRSKTRVRSSLSMSASSIDTWFASSVAFRFVARARSQTKHIRSVIYAPSDHCLEAFYSVMRAGHVQAGPDHHFERDNHPGHEIILWLDGKGHARIGGRQYEIQAGAAIWINGHHPHAYWADAEDPWEVYWLLFEGPR